MQNRYVGDIGDYVKYALLREITGRKCLGVAWYLHPDGGPAGDGRYTTYLDRSDDWRHLDDQLFTKLKELVNDRSRTVQAVQESKLLGANTIFSDQCLDVADIPSKERSSWRSKWFECVQAELRDCDLVFADPDNGLYPDKSFRPSQKVNAKRIPLKEAQDLSKGRAAVIYHHNTRRTGGHLAEIRDWMSKLSGCELAFRFKRWSPRTFFIVNPDSEIRHHLITFAQRWSEHGCLLNNAGRCCLLHQPGRGCLIH